MDYLKFLDGGSNVGAIIAIHLPMRLRHRFRVVVVAIVVAPLLVASSIGHPVPAEPTPPTFGASITVVTLPVFVTDRKGAAVTGLTADDFAVLDEDRPMKIVGFREVDALAPPSDSVAADAPAARRQFLFLFDLSFSGVNGLMRARKAAMDFVTSSMGPSDLASIATFSANHGVRVLLAFTSDRRQLQRAISTLGVLQLDQRADPLGLAFDLRDLGESVADTVQDERGQRVADSVREIAIRYERVNEAQYRQRILALLDGMAELARGLDAVQGRKQIILFSNGFDEAVLQGVQGAQSIQESESVSRGRLWEVRPENRFGDTQVRDELTRMVRAFSSSDSLVHTVDLSGLSVRGDARQMTPDPARRSGHGSLFEIADLSGGRFFKNTNDPGIALGEVLEMSRHFYLLAFEPQERKGGGKFHKLKVRVGGKGDGVSHRAGYFERGEDAARPALARRFEAAEVIAKGVTGGPIDLRAMAIPYRTQSGTIALPVVLETEPGALVAGPDGRLSLEVFGYALDEQGGVEDFVALTSNLDPARVNGRLQDRGLQCHATFTVGPGRHSLRFLVREPHTGRWGSRWLDVTVPTFDPAEVLLFPPMFMDPPARWVILEAPSQSTVRAATVFSMASEAFTPRTRPLLSNGRTEQVFLLAFDGDRRYDAGAAFEIRPQLVGANGATRPIGRVQLAKTLAEGDGFRRFVLDVTPQDVPAGEYTFRVRLRDPASGRVSEAFQSVRVE